MTRKIPVEGNGALVPPRDGAPVPSRDRTVVPPPRDRTVVPLHPR